MDFDAQWLFWALPIAFALGWIGSRFDVRQWKREEAESPKIYYRGLNLLLAEQHDKAIDAFVEAVQKDPDTFDLHFALGNLFRRRGEYERAVRVHEHLVGRADLPKAERERARHALAQDFMKAGLFDRAEASYRALADTPFATEARHALLDLHERAREWQPAIEVARELERSGVGSYASRIAHYRCEQAAEADASGQREAADAAVEQALAEAPRDARPIVVAGERAAARGDPATALRHWNTLMTVQPAAFDLVAAAYASNARATGDLGAAIGRLEALYAQAPSLELLAALVSLLPADERRRRLIAHLDGHPSLAAAQAVLRDETLRSAPGDADARGLPSTTLAALDVALRQAARPLHRYRCAACGFEAEHHFWQCPGCLGWDTYPPRRLDDT